MNAPNECLFHLTLSTTEVPPDLPYMIRRSRMHNVPVYKDITHGNRLMTLLRKIEGDIWVSTKCFSQACYELATLLENVYQIIFLLLVATISTDTDNYTLTSNLNYLSFSQVIYLICICLSN